MRKLAAAAMLAGLTLLSACNKNQDPGKPTAEEDRELNNAAEMLDASPDSLTANDEAALGNGDEGADANDSAVEADANTD